MPRRPVRAGAQPLLGFARRPGLLLPGPAFSRDLLLFYRLPASLM